METESDPINEYKASLNDLSFNSKPLINMLTMLSEDYKDSKAPQIVKCIEQRLHSVSADKKLPLLYLLDSICKNVGHIYTSLFTQNIVSTFCTVFEKVDEKTRLSLYKLRQTWSSIFPASKLYAIDYRIHYKLDPAWPITAPKPDSNQSGSNSHSNSKTELKSVVKQPNAVKTTGLTAQQQVHINPKFLSDKTLHPPISKAADPQSEFLAKQLIQKQNELLQIQKQKLEFDLLAEKRKLAEQARALQEKEMKLKQKEQQMLRSNSPNGKKAKKRKRSRSQKSRSPSPVHQKSPSRSRSPPKRWSQSPNDRLRESPQQSPSFQMRQNKVNRSRSPNTAAVKPFITPQTSIPSVVPLSSNKLPSSSKAGAGSQPPVPTTIPAPTILAQPEMLNISRMDSNVVTTMSSRNSIPISSAMNAHNVMSGQINNNIDNPFPSWGQDRDYRIKLDTMLNQANEKLRTGAISSADHDVLIREVERIRNAQNNRTNSVPNRIISEPQDTLTMLVDGKVRKLFYLDDTTAVVLLNAPQNASFDQLTTIDPRVLDPRQISFEGKPTYVYIDSERPSCQRFILDFNGQEYVYYPKDLSIPQRIKFGGPAKEIILNGQPFPAKFGGPPIQVWFEGDNSGPHSIKLDGPTPRVKLSDERRYDLWNQIIKKATTEVQTVSNNTSGPPPAAPLTDVNSLLSKLIAAGMIDNNKSQKESPKVPQKEEIKEKKREKVVTDDPPIKLSSDSLKISRPSVVAALYRGIQCTNCSLRFDDKGSENKTRYSKHLDWHFRQNRRDKAKPNSNANSMRRSWYYPLNLWVQFKEVTDEEDTTGLFPNEDTKSDVEEEQPVLTVIAEKDESLNVCAVCGEKFDPEWNQEEEEWKLLNAVKHNNLIYHPLCLNDHIAQTERQEQQLNQSVSDVNESKANVSEESIKSDIKEELTNCDEKCDNTFETKLNEPILEPDVKSESQHEDSDTNATEVSEEKVEENEEKVLSEPTEEETDIKVFEFEIPLNSDNVKHDLADILEAKEVVEDMEQQLENEEEKSGQMVVQKVAQGGIVIKMKASNPTQTTVQTPEPMETNDRQQPEVIVRGKELSSLCNIL